MFRIGEYCLECLKAGRVCTVRCSACTPDDGVCTDCDEAGHKTHVFESRRCAHCQANNLRCVRARIILIESDKGDGNLKAMLQLMGDDAPLEGLCWPIFGVQHGIKSAAGPFYNWYLEVDGDIICITDLLCLWNSSFARYLAGIITKEILIRKDKHNVQNIMRLFSHKLAQLVGGKIVKSVIYNEKYFGWKVSRVANVVAASSIFDPKQNRRPSFLNDCRICFRIHVRSP